MSDDRPSVHADGMPARIASLRAALSAHPRATAAGAYSLVATAAAIAGYFAIFTQFAAYDDEGTLLVMVNAFVHGDVLYRDIYTPYGPFYYEVFGGLFRLTGWPVSTDASRLIVVVVWVSVSGLYGLVVQRLTGRLLLGLTGMVVGFAAVGLIVAEPMHPHGLGVLLLGGLTLIAVRGPWRRPAAAGAAAGALLAALALTKINLGVFAIAAIALAAVLCTEPLRRRRWLCWPVLGAFLVLPTLIMVRDLRLDWVRDFLALELFATLAILIAAWPARPRRDEADGGLARWLVAAVAGFALAFAAILAVLLLTGPTLSDVYDGIVEQALRIRDAYVVPFTAPVAALDWGIAAVAGAALVSWLHPRGAGKPAIWPALLRIGAGLTIWFTITQSPPFSLNPPANPVVLPMVLSWVAAIAPAGQREPPYRSFARVLLPLIAVAETLQTYPVAGSQVGIAALTYVPVGALCIADGLAGLRTWSAARGPASAQLVATLVTVAIAALAGKYLFESIARPAATDAVLYRDQPSLSLPNAGLLHPPQAQAEEYERLVALLREHRCTTLVGYPSLNSLYLWSSLAVPKPQLPGPWMLLLDSRKQRRIVEEVSASPRPCAISDQAAAGDWLQGGPPPDTPLVSYVLNGFKPVAQVNEYEFLLPVRR